MGERVRGVMIRWGREGWVLLGTDQVSVLVMLLQYHASANDPASIETKSYLLYLLSCELLEILRHDGGLREERGRLS